MWNGREKERWGGGGLERMMKKMKGSDVLHGIRCASKAR